MKRIIDRYRAAEKELGELYKEIGPYLGDRVEHFVLYSHTERAQHSITRICELLPRVQDDLPPCVGEAMRDALAEHAITTLADWEDADGNLT